MEAVFTVELGKMTWDDDSYMSGVFEVLAESDPYTYEQVVSHTYPTFDLNPPVTDWIPVHYNTISPSVPEPTSAFLILIGIGTLALKRK